MNTMRKRTYIHKITKTQPLFRKALGFLIIFPAIGIFSLLTFAYHTRLLIYENHQIVSELSPTTAEVETFPVGVNPFQKKIEENPQLTTFFEKHVASRNPIERTHTGWLAKALSRLAQLTWYQNLANPSTRVLVIESGERKEQVASNFSKILGWNSDQKNSFLERIASSSPEVVEGKFFPANYIVAKGALPTDVATLVNERFSTEILSRYTSDIQKLIPLKDTLVLASLLEREAYDFEDMRSIAGVIWNRLFTDMNLQIDATLQYAKGSRSYEVWWPPVHPDDKYIDSPYNTYENAGLPPAPIANPSLDAILAALNPRQTECMYYFHDRHGEYHCSKTYEGHVSLLKQYYGRGK